MSLFRMMKFVAIVLGMCLPPALRENGCVQGLLKAQAGGTDSLGPRGICFITVFLLKH